MEINQVYHADAIDFMHSLPPGSVDMVLCDPPYGTTACKWDSVIPLEPFWEGLLHVAKPHAAIVLFSAQPFTSQLVMSNPKMFRCEWIWDKILITGFLNIQQYPLKQHESILVFGRKVPKYYPITYQGRKNEKRRLPEHHGEVYGKLKNLPVNRTGIKYPTSILRYSKLAAQKIEFPTQKPVALCEYLIRTYSQPGELVLDPTCGSGTTFVAARKTGRDYIGCDNDAGYVEVARKRLRDTDPYQPTEHETGVTQLSLFGNEISP